MAVSDLETLWVLLVYPIDPATDAEVTSPVIFANRPWATQSGDTPDAKPALAIMESSELSARWDRQQPDGLQTFGGVGRYDSVPIKILNPRMEAAGGTWVTPLDGVVGYRWSEARANLYASAPVDGSFEIALASLTQLGTFIVESFTPGSETAALSLTRPKGIDDPCTPFEFWGWGAAGGAPGSRPDHAALRSTGDFSFRCGVLFLVDNIAGPYTCFSTPLIRLRKNNASIAWELLNASSAWQAFAGFTITAFKFYQFGILYNSTTKDARLYAVGPAVTAQRLETITVTGGLDSTAAAAATVWDSSTEANFFSGTEHLSSEETEDWMLANLVRGVQIHPDSTMAMAFDEGLGTVIFDKTGNQHGTLTGGWTNTIEGKASLAGVRPAAVVGIGFGLPPLIHTEHTKLVPAYAGDRTGQVRSLTQDGVRKKPDVPTGTSGSRTITANLETITPVPLQGDFSAQQLEFADGQNLTRSPAGGAGNPTNFTVDRTDIDAVIGGAESPGTITTTTNQTADETSSFAIIDNADSEYTAAINTLTRNVTDYLYPIVNITGFTPAGVLQVHLGRAENDEDMSAIDHACQKFGPRVTPTITHESTTTEIWHHGWREEGDAPFSKLIDKIALSSLSVDNGPLAVAYTPTGGLEIYGFRLAADASDDLAVLEGYIKDIVPVFKRGKPRRAKVRYRRNWKVLDVAESISQPDELTRRLRTEWDERPSGTGTRTSIFESSLTRHSDAKIQADMLVRLQTFELYWVHLHEPVPFSLISAASAGPFRQATITWRKDAFWTSRVTWTVGFRAGHNKWSNKLSLLVATEKT